MSDRTYTVYKHTSPSGKVYIGITKQKPNQRWRKGKGYKNNIHFWRAIEKHRWDNFIHEILFEDLSKDEAQQKEIELIAYYKSDNRNYGYNIDKGGNLRSEETIEKSRQGNIGKIISKETRQKISDSLKGENNPNWGKHLSEEHKKKIGDAQRGEKNHMYGKDSSLAMEVICDNIIYKSGMACAEYYGVDFRLMNSWLTGSAGMPQNFYDMGLRYVNSNYVTRPQKKRMGSERYNAKIVICGDNIFYSVRECSDFYNIKIRTLYKWLRGATKMPKKYSDLGLRYATDEDIKMLNNRKE